MWVDTKHTGISARIPSPSSSASLETPASCIYRTGSSIFGTNGNAGLLDVLPASLLPRVQPAFMYYAAVCDNTPHRQHSPPTKAPTRHASYTWLYTLTTGLSCCRNLSSIEALLQQHYPWALPMFNAYDVEVRLLCFC